MRNGDANQTQRYPVHSQARFVSGERFIEVTLQFDLEGKLVTGQCLEMGTAAFGDTLQEAYAALVEAAALQLDTLEEAGELERFLRSNAVELQRSERPHWNPVASPPVPA